MITKGQPLYLQVEDYVRSRITSGEYAPGSRLLSTMELAALTGTSVYTVQTALARLAGEGLLHRQARRPTLVRGDRGTLSCVALYFNRAFFRADLAFYQVLGRDLEQKLRAVGVETRVWIDERSEKLQDKPVLSLKHAIQRREVQALIAPLICEDNLAWLGDLSIPVSIATTDKGRANGVFSEPEEIVRFAIDEFRREGCRSAGLIHEVPPEDGSCAHRSEFEEIFLRLATAAGLEVRPEWIARPDSGAGRAASQGYAQFMSLWELERRPEALFVFPDALAPGVITAILEEQVDVPRQLKVVFYANDRLPYPCPLPAGFVLCRVGDYAEALISSIYHQIDGCAPRPLRVRPTFLRGNIWESARPQHLLAVVS